MLRRKSGTFLIVIITSLFFLQCERNSLKTGAMDSLSLLGMDFLFSSITMQAGGFIYTDKSSYSFGTVTTGTASQSITFTMRNTGTETINFAATPIVVSGTNAGDFTVTGPGVTNLVPGTTATLSVVFTPGSAGARSGNITVMNDQIKSIYTLNMSGMGSAAAVPDIYLEIGGAYYASGSSYNFGTVTLGSSSTAAVVTIRNPGAANLTVSSSAMSGANAGDFISGLTTPVTLTSGGGVTTFNLTFTPTAVGARSGRIIIQSDDPDIGSYTINLRGTGAPTPVPEINVRVGAVNYLSGSSTYNFGSVAVGSSGIVTFTIQNLGTADLNISGISIAGSADVTTAAPGVNPVPAGSSTTFSATFTPTATGSLAAVVLTIASDDPDEGTYTINLTGTGTAPEIDIEYGGTSFASGDIHNFGSINVNNSSPAATFTINNPGTGTLNITSVILTNTTDFSTTLAATTVAAGDTMTFNVTFNPKSAGLLTGTIIITSDDADEGTYNINLEGTGVGIPDINLQIGGADYLSGDTYSFGSISVYSGSADVTFTIQNLGSAVLNLTGVPLVDVGGTNPGDFTVSTPGSSTIGLDENFTVSFWPTAAGTRDAQIIIYSDDPDALENPYIINITGTGLAPEMDLQYSGTSYGIGGTYTFAGVPVGGSSGNLIFTIDNSAGTGPLTISTPIVSGTNASEFTVANLGTTVIAAGASTTFTLNFSPVGSGSRTAELTIVSDDSDESPYTVYLEGTGTVPEIDLEIGGTSHSSGATYNFGMANAGSSIGPVTYTVRNTGTGDLNVTGYSVTGINASDFTVSGFTTGNIFAGGTMNFTVTFTPSLDGAHTATLIVNSNDADEGTYSINLEATGTAPEINLLMSAVNYLSGDTNPIGSTNISTTIGPEPCVIQNLGSGNLNVSSVTLTGANAGDYSISGFTPGDIIPGNSMVFSLSFTPSGAGTRTAVLTINSTDADEGTYTVTLQGTGVGVPEISIEYGGSNFAPEGTHDLGSINLGSSSPAATFTIYNTGTGDLDLTSVILSNTVDFSTTLAGTTIAAGNNITFNVTFNPTVVGLCTATLIINSNDADESPYNINLTGTGVGVPDINLQRSGADFGSGDGLGVAVNVGTPYVATFTIQNPGSGTLNVSEYRLTGTYTGDFSVTGPSSVAAGDLTATFDLTFTPSGPGFRTGTSLEIYTDDPDEPVYYVNLSSCQGMAPDINLQYSGSDFASGNGLGVAAYVGTPIMETFTIQNLGSGTLNISSYTLTGTYSSEFSVTGPSSVAAGSSDTFTLTFDPAGSGYRPAMLEIHSDDPDEPVYTVNLSSCYAFLPDINIKVGNINYASTGSYDFGVVQQGTSKTVTFTVQNTGTGNLTIEAPSTSVPAVFHASDPGVFGSLFYNIPDGTSQNFTVTFTPNASGSFSDTLVITSNDIDVAESPYVINLSGTGASAAVPDITLKAGATEYPSGGISAFNFGEVQLGTTKTATFTIKNNGVGGLELSTWPWIVTGSTFSVTGIDEMSIPGGGTTTFTVAYTPDAADSDTGILSIASNDTDTPTYWINLGGSGSAAAVPDIQLTVDGVEYQSGGTYNLGMVEVLNGSNGARFTITNKGTSVLTISANPSVASAAHFSAGTITPSSTIAPGGSAYFDVNFTPQSIGPLSTVLTISSDDPDTGTFALNLNGSGYSAAIPNILVSNSGGSEYYPSGCNFDFGEVLIGGSTLSVPYEIQNGGSLNLNIVSVNITGVHNGDYTITLSPGAFVAPAAVGDLEITFDPVGNGIRTAAVEIETDDPDEPVYVINLTGRGVMPMMVVNGNNSSYTSIYNPITNTFATGNPMAGSVGRGGHSFLIPTGYSYVYERYHLVLHGNVSTANSLYDPSSQTFTLHSNTVTNNVGSDAHTFPVTSGVNAGSFLIVSGSNSTLTTYFNPSTNLFSNGPAINASGNVNFGSFHLPVNGGDTLVVCGNGTSYTSLFSQSGNSFSFGANIAPTANVASGGHGFLITGGSNNGLLLVITGGGFNLTRFYDPATATFAFGPNLSATASTGAFSIPITSGTNAGRALIVHGGNTTLTSVYNTDGTIAGGPTFTDGDIGIGAFSFLITAGAYKGMFMIIHGGTTTVGVGTTITTIFDPETFTFITGTGDDLPDQAGAGAHCFPAK